MKRIALATALIMLYAAAVTDAQAGRVCKSKYGFSNTGPSKTLGKEAAKKQWSDAIADKYSMKYASWSNAKSKSLKCKKKTSSMGANYWRCSIKAKPCYYE
jgi:hypothetical protein